MIIRQLFTRSIAVAITLLFCNLDAGAQSQATVDSAFRSFHTPLMEKIIRLHTVRAYKSTNDTARNLNALIDALLTNYTSQTRHGIVRDFPELPGNEKYILMQPEINVCFASDLNHSLSNFGSDDEIPYGYKTDYLSVFVSAAFYKFPSLKNCKSWAYNVDSTKKERYIPIRIDSVLSRELYHMLYGKKGDDHYNRRAFLAKFFKVYNTSTVETLEHLTKSPIGFISYNFYINKVVFNENMTAAEIQFSLPYNSLEARYRKVDGKWTKANPIKTLLFTH